MKLDYDRVGSYVKAQAEGTSGEIAAFVLAVQERREKAVSGASEAQNISSIPTCNLVSELMKREGVKTEIAEPYKTAEIKADGPAIVLVVTD